MITFLNDIMLYYLTIFFFYYLYYFYHFLEKEREYYLDIYEKFVAKILSLNEFKAKTNKRSTNFGFKA